MSAMPPYACPMSSVCRSRLDFPVGQIRRLAPVDTGKEVDETKRNVLKLLAVGGLVAAGGGGLAAGSLQYAQPPAVGLSSYPAVQLIDLDGSPLTVAKVESEYNVMTEQVITFNYPLRNEPNFLINTAPATAGGPGATDVPGGIGHRRSIVAFSAICQHLGCPAPAINFFPPGTCPQTPGGKAFYIHCTCHGSTYDVTNGASILTGPAVLALPQVTLEWHAADDTIWAVGETTNPPVNGHLDTLQGDYGVGNQAALSQTAPIHVCNIA